MAPIAAASQTQAVTTLPRLLAINKDFTGLDEQIDQATNIIGLPEHWSSIQEEKARLPIIQKLVRSRAEWVLRWVLEKLKDNADIGAHARANPRAWKLLHWMVQVLPTSRAAGQLRDADLLSILQRTLHENFEKEIPGSMLEETEATEMKAGSESSETVRGTPAISRKRKRQSTGTSAPAKRMALSPDSLEPLFEAIVLVLGSITQKASLHGSSEEVVQREHMKMALRAETAQAARILRGWFAAVTKMLPVAAKMDSGLPDAYLDLSLVLDIWELRTMDAADSASASSEQFSLECLVPLLTLYNKLRESKAPAAGEGIALRKATESLEKLLARHLFAPARTAFFAKAATQSEGEKASGLAEDLAVNLEPLRTKILLAAQMQDEADHTPELSMPLFASIPQLLDMAIRMSPSRTPKTRLIERPWLQAAFIALIECAGCPLEAPEFAVPDASLNALEKCIDVLALHEVRIDMEILADIFWYHSGIKSPAKQKKTLRWPLIAALIKLDPNTFVTGSMLGSGDGEEPDDMAKFLFDEISAVSDQVSGLPSDAMDIDIEESPGQQSQLSSPSSEADFIVTSIVTPLMSAFARNRDLLGFIQKWDSQLCDIAPINRFALKELWPSVWEDRRLGVQLADLLEQSLTLAQINSLFEHHASLVKPEDSSNEQPVRQAFSSAVLLRALLWSIDSDETIQALEPQLRALLSSFTELVRKEWCRKNTDLASCWVALCRLLIILWPLGLHGSLESQKELIEPLLKQAHKDIGPCKKSKDERPLDSKTRAGALFFVLTICDHLCSVPGWDGTLFESVRKALKILSRGKLDDAEYEDMMVMFCVEFPHLLEYLEPDSRKESLSRLLQKIADLHGDAPERLVNSLSQTIFSSASTTLRDAYAASLQDAMGTAGDDEHLGVVGLLAVRPSALSRERREGLLDKLTDMLLSRPKYPETLLSAMNILQQVPNATANISSSGGVCFDMAQALEVSPYASLLAVQLFQNLVQQTLVHMLPNKDQAQNKKYLEKFQKKLRSLTKKPQECSPPKFAILRAAMRAQKDDDFLSWDKYVRLLVATLPGSLGSESGATTLVTLAELPTEPASEFGELFDAVQAALRQHFKATIRACTYPDDADLPIETRIQLHSLMGKYKLLPLRTFVTLSRSLLYHAPRQNQAAVLKTVKQAITPLSPDEHLDLIALLTDSLTADVLIPSSYQVLSVVISTLADKARDDPAIRVRQLALLPALCTLLSSCASSATFSALLDCIDTLIREKPSYTAQHSIECVLAALVKLSSRSSPALSASDAPAIYTRLCATTRSILLLHRSKLGGRFHLLLPVLQNLLFCLFIPHAGKYNGLPSWLRPSSIADADHLTPANASQYSRILSTLCSPTLSSVSKSHLHRTVASSSSSSKKSTLNDPVKATREYVSHYIYPLLASFCRFQLQGRLDAGVREKLVPGVWEVVGTATLDNEGLQGMFAGLDKGSRDLWRGVWAEWKGVEGRRGEGFGKGGE